MMGIPVGGFSNPGEINEWLNGVRGRNFHHFSYALSSRAAMRVTPSLNALFLAIPNKNELKYFSALLCFRLILISMTTAKVNLNAARSSVAFSSSIAIDIKPLTLGGHFLAASLAIESAKFAATVAYFIGNRKAPTFVAQFCVSTVASAVGAEEAFAIDFGSYYRTNSLRASRAAKFALEDFAFSSPIWAAVTADARALEAGATPEEMAARPLWPEGSPYKPRFDRKTFLAAAPSFEVWLDWYEPIVDGKAPWGLPRDIANKLEERIALGDYGDDGGKAFWDRDADAVNAEIKGWVEAARAAVRLGDFNTSFHWSFINGKFGIVGTGNADDDAAAKDPITIFQHNKARERLKSFSQRARAIEEIYGWQSFCPAFEALLRLVERQTVELPAEIAQLYDASLSFASFAQFDADLNAMPSGNVSALNAEDRRLYLEVVRTIAPWVRRFPTARQLDDETGQFLFKVIDPAPRIALVHGASRASLITDQDRDLVLQLLAAYQRQGFPAEKAAKRGNGATTGLALSVAAFLGGAFSGAFADNVVGEMETIKPVVSFIAEHADDFIMIAADLPSDIKVALQLMIDEARNLQGNNLPVTPEHNTAKHRNKRLR